MFQATAIGGVSLLSVVMRTTKRCFARTSKDGERRVGFELERALGLSGDVTDCQMLAVAPTGNVKNSDDVTTHSLGHVSMNPACFSMSRLCRDGETA